MNGIKRGTDVKRDEWLTNRVEYLKSLKALSEPQQLLVLLTEKPDRSAADNQLLAALVRLEQANDRAAQARLSGSQVDPIQQAPVRQGRAQGPRPSLDPAGRVVRFGGFGASQPGGVAGFALGCRQDRGPSALDGLETGR